MYNVTEAVAALFDANQPQVLRITGTDANGNAISITESDVMAGGFSIDRYSCNSNRLEIGTAIAAELTLKVANFEGEFSDIKFEGAELFVEVGIADWTQENPTVSWVPCGYFTPDEQPRNRSIITMSALDRMMKFDAVSPALTPWTTESGEYMRDELGNILYFITQLSFPATVANLVQQISVVCDVPMTQNILNLPNASLVIQEMPKMQEDVTFRKLIQWCAGLMGANAFINWNGELCFSWYSDTGYNTTPDRRFSSDIHENDIVLTGVTYTDDNQTTYLAGSDAYALDLTGNQLMVGFSDTIKESVLQGIKNVIYGFTYRAFEAKVMPAPWLFPMDRITFTDLQGNTHLSLLTNVNTTINGATVLKGSGETAQTASYAAPSGLTAAQATALRRVLQSSNEQIEAAIADATNQITGATNSNVKFVYNEQGGLSEILVMDSPNIETAVNVWRWNSGGLGHSSNGYNGNYSLAMTQDGSIVATMITAGILNASLIQAGILRDVQGTNYWNMQTGEFRLSGTSALGGTTVDQLIDDVSSMITGVDVEYAQNQSTTDAPTTGWSTTAPQWQEGYYIWQRTVTRTPDSYSYSTPVCISGRNGQDGADGKSVSILGSYNTLQELQAAHPTGNEGDGYLVAGDLYVWNGTSWEDVGRIQGPQGDQGPQGQTGATGVGVSNIIEQYYLSTSRTQTDGGSWSVLQPVWTSGKYIWTRSRINWTDGHSTFTTPVLAKAINGANSTADEANTTADEANTTANQANTTANTANATANQANTTANTANATANQASAAVTALNNSLDQDGIFNRLTNNGQSQGIYLQDGLLYINGSYMRVGIIKSQGNTGTQFDLATGEITTVGNVGAGSTFDNQTIMGGGQIQFFSGSGNNAQLAGTIGCADGSPVLVITLTNQMNIDGKIFFGGEVVFGPNALITATDSGGLGFSTYTGPLVDGNGTEFEVVNGLICM